MKLQFLLLLLLSHCYANVYLHFPRGSNNRLNEKSAARKSPNRVFDSQNNNRGGYNVGESLNVDGEQHIPGFSGGAPKQHGEGATFMPVVLTMQHGCGSDNPDVKCSIVLEYACETQNLGNEKIWNGLDVEMNDGTDQKRSAIGVAPGSGTGKDLKYYWNSQSRGMNGRAGVQESISYSTISSYRERNKGLFTADQNLNENKGATASRQNPNGDRFGFEAAEERDYFPYWHPTIWKTISVFVDDENECEYYQSESSNVKPKQMCQPSQRGMEFYAMNVIDIKKIYSANNQADCIQANGEWASYLGNYPEGFINEQAQMELWESQGLKPGQWHPKPDCKKTPWSRSNHLGVGNNGESDDENDLNYFTYMWKLPDAGEIELMGCANDGIGVKMVLRARYNITSSDLPNSTDSTKNQDFENDPTVSLSNGKVDLNLNTAQHGRVFQDRSHIFRVLHRPNEVKGSDNIHIVSVMGKRGSLEQVFPALQYEFVPNKLTITTNDWISFSWTGSNTHHNQNDGVPSDGAAGDDGQGRRGSDRNNIINVAQIGDVFPRTGEDDRSIFKVLNCPDHDGSSLDLALYLMSGGYYKNEQEGRLKNWDLGEELNEASPSLPELLCQINEAGTWHLASSRNNEPGVHSQYLTITVE